MKLPQQIPINNPTDNLQTATYNIISVAPGDCGFTSFTLVVTVSPKPNVNAMSIVSCSGSPFIVNPINGLNGMIPPDTRYDWGVPTGLNIGNGQAASNQQSINGNLTNSATLPRTATYLVTPTYGNCTGSQFTLTVTVNLAPVLNSVYRTICTGTTFTVTPTNVTDGYVPVGSSYIWSAPIYSSASMSGGSSRTTPAPNITDGPIFNLTRVPQTASYFVSLVGGENCGVANFTLVITVNPQPQINAMTAVICSGSQFIVNPEDGINGNVPINTRYAWSAPTGLNIGNGQAASNQEAVIGNLTNGVNTMRTATYIVTPSFATCNGNTFTVTVFIDPAPTINTINRTICTGTVFVITPTTGVDGYVPPSTTYTWEMPIYSNASLIGGTSRANPASNIFNGPLYNSTNIDLVASYKVTPKTGNCLGSSFSAVITVSPLPVISAMSAVVCSGSQFVLIPANSVNGIVPSATRYAWAAPSGGNFGNGQSGFDQTSINGTLTTDSNDQQTATYYVTPSVANCTGSQFTVNIIVIPSPTINNIVRTICTGTSFVVTPTTGVDGFVPNGTQYKWDAPIYSNASLSGGVSRSSFTNNIFGGPLTNPTSQTFSASYKINPQVDGSCKGNSFTLVINIAPRPVISSMSTVVCSGYTFTVSPVDGNSGFIVPADTRYSWGLPTYTTTFTGGASGSSKINIYGTIRNTSNITQTATYLVTPTTLSADCIGSVFTLLVRVNPTAEIGMLSTVVCSGYPFAVTPVNGVYKNIVPADTRYSWGLPTYTALFTGGASDSGQSRVFGNIRNSQNTTQTATYIVIPTTLSANCQGAPFTILVTVNPTAEIGTLSTVVCSGYPFVVSPVNGFMNNIVPGDTRYSWGLPSYTSTFTGGTTGSGEIQLFGTIRNTVNTVQTATYIITPTTVLGSCQGASFTVLVRVNPTAEIGVLSTVICSGYTFSVTPANGFLNYIVPADTRYTWELPTYTTTFTGGATGSTETNVFGTIRNTLNTLQTATYIVTPSTGASCVGAAFTVTVSVLPTAEISTITTVTCSGVPFVVTPTNITNGIVP
ncbi:MAG: hypothetical protein EBX50_15175, partial [Chitinophagia bacterium]|nr:hypothetical protein [Chitinophagia bacterium]